MPDPETGEPINVSHMIPRSKEDLQRRHRGPGAHRRGVGRADGPHARLHERHVRRLRRRAAGLARTGGPQRGGRRPTSPRSRQQLAREDICPHPHDRPPDGRPGRATSPSPATRCRCTRWATPSTASSCAAPASWPRWRRSPTRSPSTPATRCRADAPARVRAQLLDPDGHAGARLPVPRQRVDAGRRPVRPPAVDPLRRAGRLRDLRRRRGARATGCSSTATSTSTTR